MFVFKEVSVRSEDAARLLRELDEVLVALIGHNGQRHVCWNDFEQPRSGFIVGYTEEGEAVACIGIRCLNEQTAELKRVYARKHHPGLAFALMAAAEDWARRQGYECTVLECRDNNPHAIAFYKRGGYAVCENYPPYEEEADAVCLSKKLVDTPDLRAYRPSDRERLAPMMKRAFDYDSRLHLGEDGGPEGYADGSFLQTWFEHEDATPLTVWMNGEIIGAVNLWRHKDGHHDLGCFFIDPEKEDRGIGTGVWQLTEARYPDAEAWHTETPAFSHRNHHFYVNKCGFAVVKIENPKDWKESSFLLCKKMK